MLCEALRHLRFHDLEDYQYVGLGSILFTDFRLMHRSLGISDMISIEIQESDRDRFEWNKPYGGITMLFGSTERRLSEIDFSRPTITWLDYDGPLLGSVIEDIRALAFNASHGSVIVITVNAHPRQTASGESDVLEQVRMELGGQRVPTNLNVAGLRGWGLAELYRRVGDGEIRDALSVANGVRDIPERLSYEQLFNFQYRDGALMATFGGVFFRQQEQHDLEACSFDRLMFVRRGAEPFRIRAPNLTLREVAHLERQLSLLGSSELDIGPIPEQDAKNYVALYRYLPTFLPVEIM